MAGGGNFQGSQRRPGFTPGGPNDPASGGSGYTGGGMGRIMAQNAFGSDMVNRGSGGTDSWGGNYGDQTGYRQPGFVSGGPDDPANGGSGYMGGAMRMPEWGNAGRLASGWGGGPDWNVQNPGMGYWPGSGYPLPPRWGNAGYPDSGWGSGIQQGVGISEPAPGTPGNADMGSGGTNETVTAETAQSNPWAGISQGRLGQAQRFANAGQFGRAKQQIGLGGGNWDDVGGLLRTEAAADDNYGGDWNWGGASDADVAQAQRFANAGMMGRAKGIMGDNWNKKMHTQFQAEGNANPYVKGESMGFDWGNVGDQRLAQSKALAQQGKFGQAKKMFTGGVAGKSQGTWDPNIARQMRAWHKGNQ